MPPPLQAVTFDLDGLMFNTEMLYERVMRQLLAKRQKPFEQQLLDQMMGRPGLIALTILRDWHGLDEAVEDIYADSDSIFLDLLDRELAPMPGLEELLAALEQHNVPKGIATSSRAPVVQRMLDHFGWRQRFQFILTSGDVLHGKPNPEIYLKAAETHAIPPATMLVLEDSHNGCRAAVDSGAYAVAVPGDHSRAHDFAGAQFVADTLADRRIYEVLGLTVLLAFVLFIVGCTAQPEVVVYAALDREFSDPVLDEFTKQTKIKTLAKYDLESTKTVGLTQAIMGEASRPRCDVFWNNEILNTLRLEEQGLLEVYRSPQAEHYPELFRSPNGTWHGFAARARVLIVNTQVVSAADMPTSIHDLADPKFHKRTAIAKPLFGTTATHAACLFAVLGDDEAKEFFRGLKQNEIQVLGGNKQVAEAVASGNLAFGLTDTDDAIIEVEKGSPVKIVYPDRGEGEIGTLFIPNTLAIIKGGPHPTEARQLVDFLLTAEVEEHLAKGPSAQIPLSNQVQFKPRVETPQTVKALPVDFSAAVKKWDAAAKFINEEFLAP